MLAALCLAQSVKTASPPAPGAEAKGLPPRASAADYISQAQVGQLAIGAEFKGHSVPTAERPFDCEDYVTVEVGVFGAPGARATLSVTDFSLRINGKKTPLPSLPYAMAFSSLKDPEWEPPDQGDKKSKGGISTGGNQGDPPPTPAHMPLELQRAMQSLVKRAAMPEGDRALPQAGLLFFEYRGKTKGVRSLELIYEGPAGRASLNLEP